MRIEDPSTGVILLAAGESSRMGQPKQLLDYRGTSLIRRSAIAAMDSQLGPVIVVIGATQEKVLAELSGFNGITVEPNPVWKNGMGTSIRAGVRRMRAEFPEVSSIIILLCDQPLIESSHLRAIHQAWVDTGKSVIASAFGQTLGPPCLFSAQWFGPLESIGDSEGAKRIIMAAQDDRATVPMEMAEVDIDTPDDYRRLRSGE